MNASVKIRHIDPKTASEWLSDKWGDQRTIRKLHVDRLSGDMKQGRFRLSPDAILRVRGKLANGQHRLSAVVSSGVSSQFLIMETDDEDLYKVLDCGIKRSASDSLSGWKFAGKIPSAARYVIAYQNGLMTRGNRGPVDAAYVTRQYSLFTQPAVVEFCQSNEAELISAFEFCQPLYSARKTIPLAMSAALHFIASSSGKKPEVEDFITRIYRGFDASGNKVVNDLVSRCDANSKSKAKLPAAYIFGLAIKCFSAVVKNQPIKVLKWLDGEELPKI